MRFAFVAAIAIGALLFSAPSFARRICVDARRPAACETTIADALDIVSPDDIISISPGLYQESLTVDTPNIQIRGTRNTVVDSFGLGGPTFTVEGVATDVTFTGFTIRNSDEEGIFSEADGTVFRNLRILNTSGDCIRVNGSFAWAGNNSLYGCGGDLFAFEGSDLVFRNNSGKFAADHGVFGLGERAIVEGNSFSNIAGACIGVTGDDAEIVNNRGETCASDFVRVTGDGALIERNQGSQSNGFTIDGIGFSFRNNRVTGFLGVGASFIGTGSGGEVSNNRFELGLGEFSAFDFSGELADLRIRANFARNFLDLGMRYGSDTSDFEVSRNRLEDIGGDPGDACFDIAGSGHDFSMNRAEDCFGPGFGIAGDGGFQFLRDQASWTAGSGFDVFSSGNNLERLIVRDAATTAYRFNVDADNNFLSSSRALGENGQDGCDEGTNNFPENNNFQILGISCKF